MSNPLIVSAARSAPVLLAGSVAIPAVASLTVVTAACLVGLMVARHQTKSRLSVRYKTGEGFVFDLGRDT